MFVRPACQGLLDLFFDESPDSISTAKAICHACEYQKACLTEALERAEAYGVWGGTDYQERRLIAIASGYPVPSRRPRFEHGTSRGYAWHKREGIEIELDSQGNDVCGCRAAYRSDARERVRRYRKRKKESK